MAFEIVDGMTGTKHISSDDLSALNVATIGKADCVLGYGDDFKLTMASANSATLGTGVGMVGGKRFWNQAATNLTVQSGTQGQKRNDLVVARYAKTSAGIESITPVVVKGTPSTGTAADPATTSNDLKLWRIPLDGISVGTPVRLFDPVASLATLGDSVSPRFVAQTSTGKLYQPFRCDLPSGRMAALVCIYNNGRPLASTVFPISIFARYCTGSGICADCYYSPGGFGVHAYYTGSMLYLMADADVYRADFVVF